MSYLNGFTTTERFSGVRAVISYLLSRPNRLWAEEGEISSWLFYKSCRNGLFHTLRCMKVLLPGRKYVIMPVYTCAVVANAVYKAGCVPLYVDIDKKTLCTSNQEVMSMLHRFEGEVLAVIVQHTFGLEPPTEELEMYMQVQDLFIIEDKALSLWEYPSLESSTTAGDAVMHSFDSSKPINCGHGGLIVVNHEELKALMSRDYVVLERESYLDASKALIKRWLDGKKNKFTRKTIDRVQAFLEKLLASPLCKIENDYQIPVAEIGEKTEWIKEIRKPNKLFYYLLEEELKGIERIKNTNLGLRRYAAECHDLHEAFCSNQVYVHRVLVPKSQCSWLADRFDPRDHWYSKLQGGLLTESEAERVNQLDFPVANSAYNNYRSIVMSYNLAKEVESHG